MGSHLTDIVMMANRWAESPHLGQCTPHLLQHLIKDIALHYDWKPIKEVILDHFTLDAGLPTLDVDLLDDDVMH